MLVPDKILSPVRKNDIYSFPDFMERLIMQKHRLIFLILILRVFTQCDSLCPLGLSAKHLSIGHLPSVPENTTAKSCMSIQEARITFERYTNEDVIWSRPKCLLCGNFVGASPAEQPNLFPDRSATYFVFNIHWEGNLTLTGRYPNARYFSFTIANQLGSGQIGNGNYIRGDQIIPDPGSFNPFLYSNGRNVTDRNYTLQIVLGDPQSQDDLPPNTLYTGVLSNEKRVHLSIRTYLADIPFDGTGNVMLDGPGPSGGLPEVALNIPGGETITGPILLKILDARKEGDPNGYELGHWLTNIENSNDNINAPCLPIPVAQVFWNTDYSVTGAFDAEHPEERVRNHPPNNDGGFGSNPDTKYMLMPFSFGFGDVLVVRGKMPTHPTTRRGDVLLPEDPQVQYFSVSTGASAPSGEGWNTYCDEQIPVGEDGNYTIVVSWPWRRPSTATLENGIVWLDPKSGEGHYIGARLWVGLLYFRFQNPSPNWKNSPNNIPIPTMEIPIPQDPFIMGPYYPRGEYMSTTDFETEFKNNRVITASPTA